MDNMPPPISDIRDVIGAAEDAGRAFKRAPWWRGHGQADWPLLPKVRRPPKGQPNREQNLVLHFQAQAGTRHAKCPDRSDYVAWLFLMQHYGLATRLLDWTESILTALFFAVTEQQYDEKPGALWALNGAGLNGAQGLVPMLPVPEDGDVLPLFAAAFEDLAPTGKVVAVATHEVDLRMLIQRSAFTVHDSDTPLETLLGDYSAFLRKYDIAPKAKPRLRIQLEHLAIDTAMLFPDLDHLAADLNHRVP